jgi:glucose-6-phosphate 1-dehydrogenase
MPALFSLYCQGLLPNGFAIIGLGRSEFTDESYREEMRKAVEASGRLSELSCAWEDFAAAMTYVTGNYNDSEAYKQLQE